MTKVHAFLTKSLGDHRHEFFHICLARSQERGHDLPTLSGELIAVAAVGLMFEAQAFGPTLAAAQHFALMIAMHPAVSPGFVAEEAQHVGATKVLDALLDQRRIKPRQGGGAFEHRVGGVFAFGHAPVGQ